MFERPRQPGKLAFVVAPPESTYRTEKTPKMAEKLDERTRKLAQLG